MNRLKEGDLLNHILGQYIRFAFNDPKHYPDQPMLKDFKNKTVKQLAKDREREIQDFAKQIALNNGGEVQ